MGQGLPWYLREEDVGIHSESNREPSDGLLNQVFSKIKLAALWKMDTGLIKTLFRSDVGNRHTF